MNAPPETLRRLACLAGIALYVHGTAAAYELGGLLHPLSQTWRMYHGYGVDVCDVRFYDIASDPHTPIDRYAAMGVDPWYSFQRDRRMSDEEEIIAQAKRICRKAKIQDLRAEARCASREGWRPAMDRAANLCRVTAK